MTSGETAWGRERGERSFSPLSQTAREGKAKVKPNNQVVDNAKGHSLPYALFVRLQDQPVVVVGAGCVAARKVRSLLDHGARVRVIAPTAIDEIYALVREGRIAWERRRYERGDLRGALLAVAATDDRAVNESVRDEANELPILVNVADAPRSCTFTVPSVMKRGQLQVAVSTNGAAPGVARKIRCELEDRFPAWWGDYVDLLEAVRVLVKERVPDDAPLRKSLLESLAAAGIEARFASGERPSAEAVYHEIIASLLKEDLQ